MMLTPFGIPEMVKLPADPLTVPADAVTVLALELTTTE